MNTAACIRLLHPTAVMGRDFTVTGVNDDSTLTTWTFAQPRPTPQQLAAAWVDVQAIRAFRASLATLWKGTFTVGERAFLASLYEAVSAAVIANDLALAEEIITTAPSISVELDAKRATILQHFAQLTQLDNEPTDEEPE